MNCYDQLKNAFTTLLSTKCADLTIDQMNRVIAVLDTVSASYEVKESETALSVQDDGIPELIKTYIAVKKVEGLSPELASISRFRY